MPSIEIHPSKQTKKVKTCLADFEFELRQEMEEDAAAAAKAEAAARLRAKQLASKPLNAAIASVNVEGASRGIKREQLMPLVDLSYSESQAVKKSAIELLSTLSINGDNKDMMISAGALKPLLACCTKGIDPTVRRHALSGLAQLTAREDIRYRLCAVPEGLKACVEGIWSKDIHSKLAASECIANVASSIKLRGQLVAAGVLPAISYMITSKSHELKRRGMTALQRLATSRNSATGQTIIMTTAEDPEGDGFASEIMDQGVLQPLLSLLRGGLTIEEDLRTQAMRCECFTLAHTTPSSSFTPSHHIPLFSLSSHRRVRDGQQQRSDQDCNMRAARRCNTRRGRLTTVG